MWAPAVGGTSRMEAAAMRFNLERGTLAEAVAFAMLAC